MGGPFFMCEKNLMKIIKTENKKELEEKCALEKNKNSVQTPVKFLLATLLLKNPTRLKS
ncbi:hypothetical protein [Microbulbifer sp. THAF38]|uniref:hypothetical protein n=1 Tax=Microbulbifer sp. THAF38 TaxID=2587856 RepID=UPI0012A77F43|nr:hypothetical protein [Microbulbifer sp. THAF38]QFT53504.1 hypothetical protein FIU95_02825 [Microbulbifer sp. THAF38]